MFTTQWSYNCRKSILQYPCSYLIFFFCAWEVVHSRIISSLQEELETAVKKRILPWITVESKWIGIHMDENVEGGNRSNGEETHCSWSAGVHEGDAVEWVNIAWKQPLYIWSIGNDVTLICGIWDIYGMRVLDRRRFRSLPRLLVCFLRKVKVYKWRTFKL